MPIRLLAILCAVAALTPAFALADPPKPPPEPPEVTAVVTALDSAVEKVVAREAEAAKQRDAGLTTCLRRKLALLKGLRERVSEDRAALRPPDSSGGPDPARLRIDEAGTQTRLLAAEAEACTGDLPDSRRDELIVLGPDQEPDDDFGPPHRSTTRPRDASPSD